VTSAKVIMDKFTGKSKGFGFVEMSDATAAKKAIAELDNGTVDGRNIKVMEARPKEDRPARNNGFKNDGGFKKRWKTKLIKSVFLPNVCAVLNLFVFLSRVQRNLFILKKSMARSKVTFNKREKEKQRQ